MLAAASPIPAPVPVGLRPTTPSEGATLCAVQLVAIEGCAQELEELVLAGSAVVIGAIPHGEHLVEDE
eukprot:CAMPEP_0181188794 /NCGR_PEP_ID=MMETSP1096-20121128/11312_1 /TAXON_ID=156174 ORGANISM="Chrysochromulina ericina, Strain CCMP281" /NCGR_SAMPLE_ID=MMETSP1096 /ASSEMBLY_ACC=CAM_ASM_000453 /LENGTH=67 /DNA_ID=CAMNT_0023277891 /DNA_START=122 /DNA_END=325 /DNA_ORIENTATION=+